MRKDTFNDGGRYIPSTNTWISIPTIGAPSARYHHTAVWADTEMIVWGGLDRYIHVPGGGRYNPSNNSGLGSWTDINTNGSPHVRIYNTAIWANTKKQMIIFGGVSGIPFNDTFIFNQ